MLIDVEKIENIKVGLLVDILVDEYKKTEHKERGYIKKIISKKDREGGIFVELTNGSKGAILDIISKDQLKKENFKYYNMFLHDKRIVGIWDKNNKEFISCVRKLDKGDLYFTYLFNDLEKAQKTLKLFDNKIYQLKTISRKTTIKDNFSNIYIKAYYINNEKLISVKSLEKYEELFKRMG